MYSWCKNESIDAWKLNASQTRPAMEAVNKTGLDGGIDAIAVDTAVLCCLPDCDPGSVKVEGRYELTEHSSSDMKYEWNRNGDLMCGAGTGRWQVKTGYSGVTGQVQYSPGRPCWLENCYLTGLSCGGTKTIHVWDSISTDTWGRPTSVCRVYDNCSNHSSVLWCPYSGYGTVWRHIGEVRRNDVELACNRDPSDKDTHVWDVLNYDSAVIMPVARPFGYSNWDCTPIHPSYTPERHRRHCSAHYMRVAGEVTGNTVPITSIGELGGTVVTLVDYGGYQQGIGISAGVEFYDKETVKSGYYNYCWTRPQWTSACTNLGYGGSVKITALKASGSGCGTCTAPWQFMLTSTPIRVCISCADIGSSVINIMDSNLWNIMGDNIHGGYNPPPARVIASANGQEAYGQKDYHWGQFGLSYMPCQVKCYYGIDTCLGMVHPYVASVVPKSTTDTVLLGTAGEFKDGVLGIPVARWDPAAGTGNGTAASPYQPEWNAHGGIIRGIVADIPLKYAMGGTIIPPHIDSWGIIHIYAPLIPCDMPVERFYSTDCYFHYTCMYNLCGHKHVHDPWNH